MLEHLTTESRNPKSQNIDTLDSLAIVQLMNEEDQSISEAIRSQLPVIAKTVDVIVDRFRSGGRLVYIGAGTSGRLGVLDASECPPTFNTPPELVVGLIAGGDGALRKAVEGAEDNPMGAHTDLSKINLQSSDTLVGIASSGRTPYVLGGLEYARSRGAATVGLACNADSPMEPVCDLMIVPVVGPELVSGSTRLKAGTATKMVLNMLTTAAMIRIGKTYGNLMVDLRASNQKLLARTRRIVCQLTDLEPNAAEELLERCDGELKTAVVMHLAGMTADEARRRLHEAGGQLRVAVTDG